MATKKLVVLGMLGPTLDQGLGPKRWERWRPSVSLCQHDELLVDRYELIYQPRFASLAETVSKDIAQVSPETKVQQHRIELEDPWDLEKVYGSLLDFARRYDFKPDKEDYLVHITTGTHIVQICMFLLTETRYFPGKLIQTSPRGGGSKSHGAFSIIDLDLSKYDSIASRFQREQREGLSFLKSGIDTKNKAFNQLIERVEHVATASKDPILLMGPTGSGKSHLAKKIAELKRTRHQMNGELVEVNCATIRGDGAMSALFGHVKGAFTGALDARAGLLKKANGGLLFLDEIGELGLDEQAMLLRAIEEKIFFPVGSDKEAQSEFQLIAGTNRDLSTEVAAGRFREDLLARINLWTFTLPGLRERPEDIEPNLAYELEHCARTLGHQVTFNREARDRFISFATSPGATWVGNFRDFSAAVRRMATLASGGRIASHDVDDEISRLRTAWKRVPTKPSNSSSEHVLRFLGAERAAALDDFDRIQLEEVLRVCSAAHTLSDAGRSLFSVSRAHKKSTNDADRLRKYLARFDLEWKDLRRSPPTT